MLDWIPDLVVASAVSYLVIFFFVWLDAWFPVVPGETLVITGAVLATEGGLSVWLVFLAGFVGAIAGDNFTYMLGDKVGGPVARRFMSEGKSKERLEWAERQLRRRPWIVISARFIPGGRTAVMFASGLLDVTWRSRFLPFEVTGAFMWALLATVLGYVFGSIFEDSTWLPLLVSIMVAAVVSFVAELVDRRRTDRTETAEEATPATDHVLES